MAPDCDWRWLREVSRRLERLVEPPNKRPRMVSAHQLAELGFSLMERAEAEPMPALLFRDGLIIAFLASRPLRRRNLAAMEIDTHLIRTADNYLIAFRRHETKTGEPIEATLPDILTGPMDRYLHTFRCQIRGADRHHGVWASMKGRPMGGEAIYQRVCVHTERAFGRPINLHLFRDCVATTIAIEDPEHVQIAADLLGHASLAFTQKYYIQAQALEAARGYQTSLKRLRDNASAVLDDTKAEGDTP